MSRNRVDLIGNIGNDLSIHTTQSGQKMLKISLATNYSYTDANGQRITSTEWHSLVAFGSNAVNTSLYCRKGSKVAVMGRLQTRSYEAKDNTQRWVTEVIVEEIIFLDKNRDIE